MPGIRQGALQVSVQASELAMTSVRLRSSACSAAVRVLSSNALARV
ncbi:hypothetical protein [Pseudomonas sp. NPDC089396]